MFASDLKPTGIPIDAVTQSWWLHRQLEAYHLLASPLTVELVKQVLQKNLPERYKRYAPRVSEPENLQMWLSFILMADEIIQLWHSDKEPVLLAVSPLASDRGISSKLELIGSQQFSAARRELGIVKHWLLVLPGYPFVAPKRAYMMEKFQKHLELEASECSAIQLTKQPHDKAFSDSTFHVWNLLQSPPPWEQEQLV
jgi:hypothetical protein